MFLSRAILKVHGKPIRRFMSNTHSKSKALKDSNAYCQNLVKNSDYHNFLIGLFFPIECRDAFFAIRAFNIEIASIKDQVPRNAFQAGRLRFQYWKDILNDIYFGDGALLAQHPAGHALNHAVKDKNLTLRWFERSLEARYKDMANNSAMETMDDLETYAEMGHSSILYLLLEALEVKDSNAEFAASHIGVCSGILTLLLGIRHHVSQNSCYFPSEVMRKHGMGVNILLKGPTSPEEHVALCDTTHDIAMQAEAHLQQARNLNKMNLPPRAIHALQPAIYSSYLLDTMKSSHYDPLVFSGHTLAGFDLLKLQYNLVTSRFTRKF